MVGAARRCLALPWGLGHREHGASAQRQWSESQGCGLFSEDPNSRGQLLGATHSSPGGNLGFGAWRTEGAGLGDAPERK